jgi:dipeptidyl aminopeptidase/acylaminoacyl peptidase
MDPASREAQLLGAAPPTVPEFAAQASPISHVSPTAPPFLLLHGRADRMVPTVQSQRMYDALIAIGGSAELHLYDGADHMWLGAPDAAEDAVSRTITFVHRQFQTTPHGARNTQGDNG